MINPPIRRLLEIRPERVGDAAAIRAVTIAAFGQSGEADLIDALRARARPLVSLAAEADGELAGHIMFSPVTHSARSDRLLMGLAPMAVAPTRQRSGIGSALVSAGLDACRRLGAAAAVVVGHPRFYPRFGFAPASRFGLTCEYNVPDDVFMAVELVEGALTLSPGLVRYHPAFGAI
jgi:putative acetyltransferase